MGKWKLEKQTLPSLSWEKLNTIIHYQKGTMFCGYRIKKPKMETEPRQSHVKQQPEIHLETLTKNSYSELW